MDVIVLLILGIIVLPGVAYFLSSERDTTTDPFLLFLKSAWKSHAVFIVPVFLVAILIGELDFWFINKVSETWSAGRGGHYAALIFAYFYFIFYLTILLGPLHFIERKDAKKVNRVAYAFVIVWFWSSVYFIQQVLVNLPSIAVKIFPVNNESMSQAYFIGFILLSIISINLLSKNLYSDIKESLKPKKKEIKKENNNQFTATS